MFNDDVTPELHPIEAAAPEPRRESSRRDFLRQFAVAGAGVAGLATLSQETSQAAPQADYLLGVYTVNQNYAVNTLRIESQSGSAIVGRFDDGTGIQGHVVGDKSTGITLMFYRLLPDGTNRLYHGTVATRPIATGKDVIIAGAYYQDGSGPLPWFATGTARG
jgi:hypothetical protein